MPPCPTSRCSSQGGFSSAVNARAGCREWRRSLATNSVCTNKLLKAGMRCVRSLGGEHDFGVTRQFDRARRWRNDWSW